MVFAGMLPWQFFANALGVLQPEHRRQCKPHFQGLLSAHHRPGQFRRSGLRGFPDLLHDLDRHDGLVSILPKLAHSHAPHFRPSRLCRRTGARPHYHRPQRQISRLPIRDPLHRADRPVCFARGLQQQRDPREIRRHGLHALLAQSHGRRDRRLPLGDPRRQQHDLSARLLPFDRADPRPARRRHLVFPQDGADVRRPHLTTANVEV